MGIVDCWFVFSLLNNGPDISSTTVCGPGVMIIVSEVWYQCPPVPAHSLLTTAGSLENSRPIYSNTTIQYNMCIGEILTHGMIPSRPDHLWLGGLAYAREKQPFLGQ